MNNFAVTLCSFAAVELHVSDGSGLRTCLSLADRLKFNFQEHASANCSFYTRIKCRSTF